MDKANKNKDTITENNSISGFKALNNAEFKQVTLTTTQKEILFGCLLGDFYLQIQKNGANYRLRAQQTFPEHEAYLVKLFDEFQFLCQSEPSKVTRIKNKTVDLRFQTSSYFGFKEIGDLFYTDGKGNKVNKKLPSFEETYKRLTPIALAYWYMDDGCIDGNNPRGCAFNTHNFSNAETEMLIDILKKKYQLQAKSRLNKGKTIIVISANSCEDFNKLVKPYTIESMYYKLPGYKKE